MTRERRTVKRLEYKVLAGTFTAKACIHSLPGLELLFLAVPLPAKIHLVKTIVFPIVTYGCESQTVKKAECRRIDAFELWCWRRLLRVPWTAEKSNQSILMEISPEYSLEAETPILWPPDAKN